MDAPASNAAPGGASAPQLGTAEYDAAMAAKGASVPTTSFSTDGFSATKVNDPAPVPPNEETPEVPQDRPQWLPEKFKSPEEMAASYAELEKRLSGQQPPKADDATPPKTDDAPKSETPELPSGLNFDDFSSEYETNGGLSDASYEKLAKAGINRDMVDAYIAGQELRAQQYMDVGYQAVGGQEQYQTMVEWAKSNLSKPEIAAFNNQVATGDAATLKLAVAGLQSKFVAANGQQPTGLLMGNAGTLQTTGAFMSRAEVTEAMSDPRYQRDPAYRAKVMDRLAKSSVF